MGDPFYYTNEEVLFDVADGLIIVNNGLIEAVGSYVQLIDTLNPNTLVIDYSGYFISAGFIDAHVHYVQTPIIASYGKHLLDWLNTYTFPNEENFIDKQYSSEVASVFFDELLRNGTTTALTFCAVYPESVEAFFEQASKRNMRMIGGKVLMDRNAPQALLDTIQSGYDDSKNLIEKWHNTGRNMYSIMPRFAPTSTQGQLESAASLHGEFPDTLLHSHVSENITELAWVHSLFPKCKSYLDVYDSAGLLGKQTVLAHGVHLSLAEKYSCAQTGTAIVHCPSSNLFLGSGMLDLYSLKSSESPIAVALGSDVGAGTSFSLLRTMGDAYKISEFGSQPLDGIKLFYLATLGGAHTLNIADKVGSIAVGKEADLVILDPSATPLLEYRSKQVGSLEEQLFLFCTIGDDRAVAATYVAGQLAYER